MCPGLIWVNKESPTDITTQHFRAGTSWEPSLGAGSQARWGRQCSHGPSRAHNQQTQPRHGLGLSPSEVTPVPLLTVLQSLHCAHHYHLLWHPMCCWKHQRRKWRALYCPGSVLTCPLMSYSLLAVPQGASINVAWDPEERIERKKKNC